MTQWSAGAEGRGVASWPGWGNGGEVGKAGQELAGSVPALVPGFYGWPWAEGDPQGDLTGWAGAGLSGTATSEGLSVCHPGVLSGLWHCQWGCDPYKCLFLVGVFVAGQGCARLPLLSRWGRGRQKRDLPPATGWLLSQQTTDCQTHRAKCGEGHFSLP